MPFIPIRNSIHRHVLPFHAEHHFSNILGLYFQSYLFLVFLSRSVHGSQHYRFGL